jgi:nucleoside-diphosphate kinase
MIKPDGVEKSTQILKELDILGERISTQTIERTPQEIIEAHYSAYKEREFYNPMIQFFTGNRVIISVYQGRGIIQSLIKAIGVTEPAKAGLDTIRGKYGGNESYELARSQGRKFIFNIIHRSDSIEEAEREIKIWRQFLPYSLFLESSL